MGSLGEKVREMRQGGVRVRAEGTVMESRTARNACKVPCLCLSRIARADL